MFVHVEDVDDIVSVRSFLREAEFVGDMGPIGRDAFTAAELETFRGAASGIDDEEGGLAGHVGDIADLAAVGRPAGGGFDVAVIGKAFRLVGREVVAVEIICCAARCVNSSCGSGGWK